MMKYVRMEKSGFILLPRNVNHKQALEAVPNEEPVSAGFVMVKGGKFMCQGESMSLNIKSKPGDSDDLVSQLWGMK